MWLDGANGGDSYYGGARETRKIDRRNYYDFPKIHATIETTALRVSFYENRGPLCINNIEAYCVN